MRVALDAMGGDHAPAAAVAGALMAARAGVEVVLVGDPGVLGGFEGVGGDGGLVVVAATDAVGMGEDPALALRAKPDASVRVAARLLATGEVGAMLSAGSTGATLAAGLLEVGRIPGVRCPVVAAVVPAAGGDVVLVDAGGSPDVQPEALVGHARAGAAYARVLGVAAPRIGLLNVGTEPGKGSVFAKAAEQALAAEEGFAGNVEPAGVLGGAVDVVVTDGFTGNIFLKTVEAAAPQRGHGSGAAVLVGLAGDVLVAHGAADAEEIAAALRTADRVGRAGLAARIAAAFAPDRTQAAAGGSAPSRRRSAREVRMAP